MLIQEHTVISAADMAIRTKSYINALFLDACDLEDVFFETASDIVNLFDVLVDNRKFTLLPAQNQYQIQNWYLGQMPFLS